MISPAEIVAKGYMKKADWDFCAKKAIELFVFGQKVNMFLKFSYQKNMD